MLLAILRQFWRSEQGTGVASTVAYGAGKLVSMALGAGLASTVALGAGKLASAESGTGIASTVQTGAGKLLSAAHGTGIASGAVCGAGKLQGLRAGSGRAPGAILAAGKLVSVASGSGVPSSNLFGNGIFGQAGINLHQGQGIPTTEMFGAGTVTHQRPATLKQACIRYLMQVCQNMTNSPTPVWHKVINGNAFQVTAAELPCVGFEEIRTANTELISNIEMKVMRLSVTFQFPPRSDVDRYERFNYYLGLLQRGLLADFTVGGNALDIYEAGNSPDIEGRSDPRPGGHLLLVIRFRHRLGQPYTKP